MTNYMQRWYSYAHFLKNFFFLIWPILTSLLNLLQCSLPGEPPGKPNVTILLLFYVLGFFFWPWGKSDLSSPTRDLTHTPYIGRWSLNYWTVREKPCMLNFEVTGVTYLWEQPHRCSWKEKGCQLIKGQTKTVWQDWSPGYQPSSQSSWHLWSR